MEKNISNRRVYTYIAVVFLAIFIIGIIALGVFRFSSGSGSYNPTYYSYLVNNSNISNDSHLEDDNKTFILNTNVRYHETLIIKADNSAVVGPHSHPDSYVFGGAGISFTLSINEEEYYLGYAYIESIRVSNIDSSTDTYLLPENSYSREYDSVNKTYTVTLNNTEVRYIHVITMYYAVAKK